MRHKRQKVPDENRRRQARGPRRVPLAGGVDQAEHDLVRTVLRSGPHLRPERRHSGALHSTVSPGIIIQGSFRRTA